MGTFKDLRVWEEAVELAANIYHITRKTPFSNDYGLSNQIQRSGVSVSSNIAEGEERDSIKDTIRFLNIAKGSSAEVITQLLIAYKIGYINKTTFTKLENQTDKIRAQIKNLIKSKKNNIV